jgi:myo-inositol-1(or 4)-monophosphatase
MVAGVVFDPSRDQLYRAVRNGGAWCNEAAISCSDLDRAATALVATGFGYDPERRRAQAEVLVAVLPLIRDIRRSGSAALDLCAMASGQVDAYYEAGLNQWDMAAGTLIAQEAGAVVENLEGGPPDRGFLLAAPPPLFETLRNLLRETGAHQSS